MLTQIHKTFVKHEELNILECLIQVITFYQHLFTELDLRDLVFIEKIIRVMITNLALQIPAKGEMKMRKLEFKIATYIFFHLNMSKSFKN